MGETRIRAFDFEHLCLTGFSSTPADLGEIPPEGTYSLQVAVCDYIEEEGERDSLIRGKIDLLHSGSEDPTQISWSFTPVLSVGNQSNDSGI